MHYSQITMFIGLILRLRFVPNIDLRNFHGLHHCGSSIKGNELPRNWSVLTEVEVVILDGVIIPHEVTENPVTVSNSLWAPSHLHVADPGVVTVVPLHIHFSMSIAA